MLDKYPFVEKIPFDIYIEDAYQGQYLTSHFLAEFRTCPQLYKQRISGDVQSEDTAAFQVGRATHALILGGQELFDEEYLVSTGPINPKTGEPYGKQTRAYKEWASGQQKKIILPYEFDFMQKLQDAVWRHPKAAELLEGSICEGTIRSEYFGMKVQIRMDAFNPDVFAISDLKTCENLDSFRNDCFKYGYPQQMAFYQEVFKMASGEEAPSMWLIAVEKRAPYRCGVWKVSSAMLAHARSLNEAALSELRVCLQRDVWPTRYESVRILDLPDDKERSCIM